MKEFYERFFLSSGQKELTELRTDLILESLHKPSKANSKNKNKNPKIQKKTKVIMKKERNEFWGNSALLAKNIGVSKSSNTLPMSSLL